MGKDNSGHGNPGQDRPDKNWFFFYKTTKVSASKEVLTGAEIKAAIKAVVNDFDPTHALFLEGHGNQEDRQISDGDSVSFALGEGEGAKHFYSKPPTNYGR